MSQCPECGRVYDESDGGCPWCEGYGKRPPMKILYKRKKKVVKKEK